MLQSVIGQLFKFRNCVAASAAMRKPAVSMADSTDIR